MSNRVRLLPDGTKIPVSEEEYETLCKKQREALIARKVAINNQIKENPAIIYEKLEKIEKQNAEILNKLNALFAMSSSRIQKEHCDELGKALDGIKNLSAYN